MSRFADGGPHAPSARPRPFFPELPDFGAPRGPKAPAPAPEAPAEPAIDAATLAREVAAAHAAGIAEGRAEAEAAIGQRIAEALAAIEDGAKRLLERRDEDRTEARAGAITLVRAILGRLAPALAARTAESAVLELLETRLAEGCEAPRLVLTVPPELEEALKPKIDKIAERAGYSGRIVVRGDASLAAGAARLEWEDGGLALDPDRLAREIEACLDTLS